MTPEEQAAKTYLARQDRTEHPEGKFDKGGRFIPTGTDYQKCCERIRYPSRAYPYSYMTHCRSAEHVATMFGVDVKAVRQTVRMMKLQERVNNAG